LGNTAVDNIYDDNPTKMDGFVAAARMEYSYRKAGVHKAIDDIEHLLVSQINFAKWRLIFVDPQHGTCFMSI
jgi:hypothetical protein